MKIKFVEHLESGYFNLKAVAELKNFPIDHPYSKDYTITIPEGYTIVTDGNLWNVVKN